MSWRSEIYFKLIAERKTNLLNEILPTEEWKRRVKNGRRAEGLVVESISGLRNIVRSARKGNIEDDRSLNDVLVSFVNDFHLPLTIQIKTSEYGVEKYHAQLPGHEDSRRMLLQVDPEKDKKKHIQSRFLAELRKMDGYI